MRVHFAPARQNPRPCRRPVTPAVYRPPAAPWRRSACLGALADPLALDATEREPHAHVRSDDAKYGLVLLGPGLVDDLHERQLVDLDAGALGLEGPAGGGLECAALPPPVGGPGGGQRADDGAE